MSMTWICCPFCNEVEDVWRIGSTGVPESRYGSRVRIPDSKLFKCNFCDKTFFSDGATRREVMGYDPNAKVPF